MHYARASLDSLEKRTMCEHVRPHVYTYVNYPGF